MEFPQIELIAGPDDGGREPIAERIDALGISAPFVLASQHGAHLVEGLRGPGPGGPPRAGADVSWASDLGSSAHRSGADAIVAVGGGRCLDIGKLAAARAGLNLVAVPTQLSHDGICSPVAVVPDETGRTVSLGAITPMAVLLPMATIARAPIESIRAGLGDLLANPMALRDWMLAADRGLSEIDQRAFDLSVASFEMIEGDLDTDPSESMADPEFLRRLANALILSGEAMITAGTSRPASGAEHEVSHAIDQLFGGRAHHGAQVAFGTLFSASIYGESTDSLRKRLRTLGLPESPDQLGLDTNDLVRILLRAPDTRPGRFTIIEEAGLDEAKARALIRRIWRER